MRHCTKIINFVRLNLTHNMDKVCRICEITVVQEKFDIIAFMAVLV